MARNTFISDYMNEVVSYGGIPTRRVDIIRDLQSKGLTRREIDYYLIGIAQRQELGRKLNRKED